MKKIILACFTVAICFSGAYAQKSNKKATKDEGYNFTTVKENPITPVKNQYKSGTCWSFSGLALVEAELLRTGKGEYDLADMFIVRHTYMDKMEKYVRYHGNINFGGGGAFHDVINMIKKYGIVPEEDYTGLNYGEDNHIHAELDATMDALAKAFAKSKKPTSAWKTASNAVLDAYLGVAPENFTYKGTKYNPVSFAKSLGLNWDDYVEVTSFTHHPFYTSFIIEVPDNWSFDKVYNVQLDEMIQVMDEAINAGYTIGWASDVSEKGFSWRNGVAIVPDEVKQDLGGSEQEKWEKMNDAEKAAMLYKFDKPVKEKTITQELRQQGFDNFETTDDHGMLIYGIAKDQNGNKYYMVKNSWGTDHKYKGIFYASEAFVRAKTISIMINKNSLNSNLKGKLSL
ncbi:C1 family peptidase [Bacteroidales bacterium OttesenSCG-928-C19]|nr:C1 family peptidase [Bacteroidales bacterium OttesenSCG-928-C19]